MERQGPLCVYRAAEEERRLSVQRQSPPLLCLSPHALPFGAVLPISRRSSRGLCLLGRGGGQHLPVRHGDSCLSGVELDQELGVVRRPLNLMPLVHGPGGDADEGGDCCRHGYTEAADREGLQQQPRHKTNQRAGAGKPQSIGAAETKKDAEEKEKHKQRQAGSGITTLMHAAAGSRRRGCQRQQSAAGMTLRMKCVSFSFADFGRKRGGLLRIASATCRGGSVLLWVLKEHQECIAKPLDGTGHKSIVPPFVSE
ncbi:hypothetical protein Esti_000393 [Eimeria stiedai]